MENEQKLKYLFQNIQDATEISYSRGQIERLLEEYSCIGCSNNCLNREEGEVYCEDCYKCGCSKCASNCDFDCDWLHSHSLYKEELEKKLLKTIQESHLGAETWASVVSVDFIRKYFPYSENREIWKKYVFQDGVKMHLPQNMGWDSLIESDKRFFYNPQETHKNFAHNYNIMRIMAGMSSLNYSS